MHVPLHFTVECYGCNGCSTYPKQPLLFTDIVLTQGGTPVSEVPWKINPKPQPKQECKEATQIVSSSAITVTFQ